MSKTPDISLISNGHISSIHKDEDFPKNADVNIDHNDDASVASDPNKGQKISLKYAAVVPVLFLVFFAHGINSFLLSEWTQNKLQREYFPGVTVTNNFSACGETNHSDPNYIRYKTVQQDSAKWVMYFSIANKIPMLLSNLLLNGYTDMYGRKFLFLLVTFGQTLTFTLNTVIMYCDASFFYMIGTNLFDGCIGSSAALLAVAFSYIADITLTANYRVLGIVFIEAVLIFSTILTSVLSGYLVETWQLGFYKTSLISTMTCGTAFLITIVILPESLSKSVRRPASSVLATIRNMVDFYISVDFKGKRRKYILLLLGLSFAVLSGSNRTNIEVLYFLGLPFCWGPSKIGVFNMTRHASIGIVGIVCMKILQKFVSNEVIAIFSSISYVTSFMFEALATSNVTIYMVPVAGVLSFLIVPMTRGLMSNMTNPDKQGAIFSSIAVMETLVSICSSFSENQIYSATYSFMNGFVFLVMAGFGMMDFGIMVAIYCLKRREENGETTDYIELMEDLDMKKALP